MAPGVQSGDPEISIPGQWMHLLVSYLEVQPVVTLCMYPKHTEDTEAYYSLTDDMLSFCLQLIFIFV